MTPKLELTPIIFINESVIFINESDINHRDRTNYVTSDLTMDQAFSAYGRGRYKEALPFLSQLADKGDIHSLLAVAWINETGAVGSPNMEFAHACYRRAAEAGSLDALYRLGRLLKDSNRMDEARTSFELGAEKGSLPCACGLGILLVDFPSQDKDVQEGIHWLNIAANRGHFFAKRRLLKLKRQQKLSVHENINLKIDFTILTIRFLIEHFGNSSSDKIT